MTKAIIRSLFNSSNLIVLLLGLLRTTSVLSQQEQREECFCHAITFELVLKFDIECDDTDIVWPTDAIEDVACVVENGFPVDDPFPVSISNVNFAEVDEKLNVIKSRNITRNFNEGDTVRFRSNIIDDQTIIPRGVSFTATGVNAAGQTLTNTWVIIYSNDCGYYPEVNVGNQIGWTEFIEVESPSTDLCPSVTDPTPAPTPAVKVGEDICACNPGTYEFTLDLSIGCDDVNVPFPTDTISETLCFVEDEDLLPALDPVPVSFTKVVITELDQELQVIKQVEITDNLDDGSTFSFISSAFENASELIAESVPRGLEISVTGVNADGETITNGWIMIYTNSCDGYPVLEEGFHVGWTFVSGTSPPVGEVCPVSIGPTASPVEPEPIEPTDPPVEPTDPPVEPTPAPVEPTEPPAAPTEPPVTPTAPPVEPTTPPEPKCACSPVVYDLEFNFDLTCDDTNIVYPSNTILDVACSVENGFPVEDPFPVAVSNVLIWELDQDANVVKQRNVTRSFENGDRIRVRSAVAQDEELVPSGLTLIATGVNAGGQTIINTWVILFTNDCDSFPVIQGGDQIGWTEIYRVEDPSNDICPGVPVPTPAPTPAVIVGEDICACNPGTYEFTLDLSIGCADANVPFPTDTIAETLCFVEDEDLLPALDPVPVSFSKVVVQELDQELQVIKEVEITDNLDDGSTFSFVSTAFEDASDLTPDSVPRGLKISVTGVNDAGETITNAWIMIYTNSCDGYPVLEEGFHVGWTFVSGTSPPVGEVCPVSVGPTDPPIEPTDPPVEPTDPPFEPTPSPIEPTEPPAEPTIPPELKCACSPVVYDLQLNFGLSCDDNNIVYPSNSIDDAACSVESSLPDLDDPVPVAVSNVIILELDQESNVVKQRNLTRSYENGDTLRFRSSVIDDDSNVPSGISLIATGVNAAGQTLINTWTILFTNNCDSFPVIQARDQIGWTEIYRVEAPPDDVCPSVTTTAPSSTPSPTDEGTPSPTDEGTPSPTDEGTLSPTDAGTPSPTDAGTPSPTDAGTPSPSDGGIVIGEDICACQPSEYIFALDFSASCEDSNIDFPTRFVEEAVCVVENDFPVDDPLPVSVSNVFISELDQDLQELKSANITDTFFDGDSFTFTSFIFDNPFDVTLETLPKAIQVSVTGVNAGGQKINNNWVIIFTNNCNGYPALDSSKQIGWTQFSTVSGPPEEVCPRGEETVDTPTLSPTTTPETDEPVSDAPTATPGTTSEPVVGPTAIPISIGPVTLSPTESPGQLETASPSAPTASPIEGVSDAPTSLPTTACSSSSSKSGSSKRNSSKGGSSALRSSKGNSTSKKNITKKKKDEESDSKSKHKLTKPKSSKTISGSSKNNSSKARSNRSTRERRLRRGMKGTTS